MTGDMDTGYPPHLPATGEVYIYNWEANQWEGPNGERITQEDVLTRMGFRATQDRAPQAGTQVVDP